jgi:hypothetical protein
VGLAPIIGKDGTGVQTELRFTLTLDNVLVKLGNVPDTLIFQTLGTRAPVVSLIDSLSRDRYTTQLWSNLHASGYWCRDRRGSLGPGLLGQGDGALGLTGSFSLTSWDVVRRSDVVGMMDVVQMDAVRYRAEIEDALGRFIDQECLAPDLDTVPSPQMVRALAARQVLAGRDVSDFVGMMAGVLASKQEPGGRVTGPHIRIGRKPWTPPS